METVIYTFNISLMLLKRAISYFLVPLITEKCKHVDFRFRVELWFIEWNIVLRLDFLEGISSGVHVTHRSLIL